MFVANMLMEITTGYLMHLITSGLKHTITTSVHAAVDSMNAALLFAVGQSVPRGSFRITKYPSLFSDFNLLYV
jgi:hypothetical protein